MAANLLGRYVWLIDTLRRYKRLTFQEISELWQESGLGYGEELNYLCAHSTIIRKPSRTSSTCILSVTGKTAIGIT